MKGGINMVCCDIHPEIVKIPYFPTGGELIGNILGVLAGLALVLLFAWIVTKGRF
jgi:hypothetical protein